MSDVLAIVPARTGSKGIANKNFRPLAGVAPFQRAVNVAVDAGCEVMLSTDLVTGPWDMPDSAGRRRILRRPLELAQDDTPMLAVVQHVLAEIPGPEDQIILLVQPTQPLRTPEHLQRAIVRMQTREWDSVVSITPIPRTHAPDFVVMYGDSALCASLWNGQPWSKIPARRQGVPQPYVRDGTVYAFVRATVQRFGNLYGEYVSGLIIPPSETCPLDTPEDWAEAERRLRGQTPSDHA